MLNGKISAEEITKAGKNSKNNKSSGDNLIINEYISSSLDCMIDIYVHIFNLIFDTGYIVSLYQCITMVYGNKDCVYPTIQDKSVIGL
jgi:hypothetical protein